MYRYDQSKIQIESQYQYFIHGAGSNPDFDSIIKNLPNLEYLTMMNMRFFRYEWLKDILSLINLHTNMCVFYPTTECTTAASYWTSTGEYFTDIFI